MGFRVLVGTDGSALSRRTADFVVRLARVLPLEIDLALAVDLSRVEYKMLADMYVDMIRDGAKNTAEMVLAKEADYFTEQGVTVQPKILIGQPGPALCGAAVSADYAFVVVGRKGEGGDIQDLLFGSTSNWVVHHCKKPVLVVKGRGPIATGDAAKRPVRVLAAVDGSHGAQRALDFLKDLRSPEGLDLGLVNVVNAEKVDLGHLPADVRYNALEELHREAQAIVDRCAKPLTDAGWRVTPRVEEGVPAKVLCKIYQEDQFEITVLGHRGMSELGDVLFGSVSNYVLHHCPGHILMVP